MFWVRTLLVYPVVVRWEVMVSWVGLLPGRRQAAANTGEEEIVG